MPLLKEGERPFAHAVSKLVSCNPFLPERIEAEREALGLDFVAGAPVWHPRADRQPENPNVRKLNEQAEALAEGLCRRLAGGVRGTAEELAIYEDLIMYLLYQRCNDELYQVIVDRRAATGRINFYARFLQDLQRFLGAPRGAFPALREPQHLFALFFQVRRAFHFTFRNIMGGSLPAARLRAAVWQSIFTHDIRRYRRSLYQRMGDVTTLITGPSGTGKELVAQAIGLAQYLPFDPDKQVFLQDFSGSFYAVSLSALSPTLIESELFGHKRGAFTGAVQDRVGWLEVCPSRGAVFLDEIAEVGVPIQVKLLRVLQTRTFQRLGETRERRFHGKIIAATNRDLAAEMRGGRFREDLYYRLCSDLIETPPLEEQLRDSPEELSGLLLFLARRIAGDDDAETLADEANRWIGKHLGRDYGWPGNVRELEQCVRNVMIRGEYRPPRPGPRGVRDDLAQSFLSGALTADELMRSYCTLVYARTGSYQEAARQLGLDRRTVREKVDAKRLARLRGGEGGGPAAGTRRGTREAGD